MVNARALLVGMLFRWSLHVVVGKARLIFSEDRRVERLMTKISHLLDRRISYIVVNVLRILNAKLVGLLLI